LLVPWIPGLAPAVLADHYRGEVLVVHPFRESPNPAYAAFARAYRTRFGSEPTPAAAYAYDAVNLVASALEHSGLNRAGLRDAIAGQTGLVGTTGRIAWDNGGGNRAEPVLLVVPGATAPDGPGRN
jgi:branched-chain amino acid transport system substrate-binding protein